MSMVNNAMMEISMKEMGKILLFINNTWLDAIKYAGKSQASHVCGVKISIRPNVPQFVEIRVLLTERIAMMATQNLVMGVQKNAN